MKKSLSLLVAIAMVFSMFAAVASAAEDTKLTTEQKYEELVEAGLFNGYDDGEAHLDREMTRAQASKIVALLTGYSEGVEVKDAGYTDLVGAGWAADYINYATQVGILEGKGNNKFDPSANVTVQQLATIAVKLAKHAGVEVPAGEEVEGTVDAWAADAVASAIAAGLLPKQDDYTVAAERSLLVEVVYSAQEILEQANVPAVSAKATGAKKITVSFNKAVDSSKSAITVKNNNVAVNIKEAVWADDKKSVELEFGNALAAAEYTVSVTGLSEEALTATVKVEAEKVANIEFQSDKAPLKRGVNDEVSIGYVVTNQYGENITAKTNLTATSSKGIATPDASTGVVKIDANGGFFNINETLHVSLLHIEGAYKSTTATVSSEARVAAVSISKLYQADGKVLEVGGAAASTFKLLVELKDQYGNKVTDLTNINDDVIVTVTNPTVATVDSFVVANNTAQYSHETVDGVNYVALALDDAVTAGTSTVTLMSKTTGAKASYDVVVKDQIKVDQLTLSAPISAPAGATVEIPFTAVDQFGNAITHPTNSQINLSSSTVTGSGTVVGFVKDVVKNSTSLKVTLPVNKGTAIVTILTGTNKVAQLTVTVTDPKAATVISGTKDLTTAVLKTGTVTLAKGNVVVKDQYNNDFAVQLAEAADNVAAANGLYRIVATSSNANVTLTNGGVILDDQSVVLNAANKGSATITLKLEKSDGVAWKEVVNASYSFNFKVVEKSDIKSYEASVSGTLYKNADAKYAKDVKVVGLLSDNSKVAIPNVSANYSVSVNTVGVTYTAATGKIAADGAVVLEDNAAEVPVVVVVITADGSEVLHATAKVSGKTPVVTKTELQTKGDVTKVNAETISISVGDVTDQTELEAAVKDAILAKDQYDVDITAAYSAIVANGFENATGLGDLVEGSTFKVTAVTTNNVIVTFKVVITN